MNAIYKKHILKFKRPGGTSRGLMTEKETWFLILNKNGKTGIGECGLLRSLSIDDRPDYEEKLQWVCENIHIGELALCEALVEFPSIQFGVEMAFLSVCSENPFVLFPSAFTKGKESIPINGLIWMGDPGFMKAQIEEKLALGFNCIKLKIGAIDFEKEVALLRFIRTYYSADRIEIRVDANGGFTSENAFDKIEQISEFQIHSIEQPIKTNQHDKMAALCKSAKIPIALDEELIGVFSLGEKERLLQKIKPQYVILKPSLIGGFSGSQEWISVAEKHNVEWWITSALESNIGLNAIAQWTFLQENNMPQGLGTGGLYSNNINSPLEVSDGQLWYRAGNKWGSV